MSYEVPLPDLNEQERMRIRDFFEKKGLPLHVAFTFKDVALSERYSNVRSRNSAGLDLSACLANDLFLNIPIVSANMESVTGARLAVALARQGGIACVPQTLALEKRLELIRRVRRTDSAFISHPLTVDPDATLRAAKRLMDQFGIYSLVVVGHDKKPLGILGTRDWRYEADEERSVKELVPDREVIVGREGISFADARELLMRHRIEKLPLVNESGELVGLLTAHGLCYERHYPRALRDESGRFLVAGSIGVGETWDDRRLREVQAQLEAGASAILVDTARAHSANMMETVRGVRKEFPNIPLIAGNVSTPAGAKCLFEEGADTVKVNQGRGSACSTSEVAAVGLPQLFAVAACAAIAEGYKDACIMADGGMKIPADIAKALAAGAHSVMTGAFLVGTDESEAETYPNEEGFLAKRYKGSASADAQKDRIAQGTLDRMRRPEGRTREVPVVGSLADRVEDMLGALRSAMSYAGASTLDELREQATFVLQTEAGYREGVKSEKY